MFRDIFNPRIKEVVGEEAKRSLENEDFQSFTSYWKQLSPEVRGEVAKGAYLASSPEFANQLFGFFENRLSQAKNPDRKDMITALGVLGGRCPEVELKSSDLLMNLIDTEKVNRVEVVRSLHSKATFFSLPLLKGEEISEEKKSRVNSIVHKLLTLATNEDEDVHVRLTAVQGVGDFSKVEGLQGDIEDSLKSIVRNEDLKKVAVDELVKIVSPGDPPVLEQLHLIADTFDFAKAPSLEKMQLAQNFKKIGTPESLKYISSLMDDQDRFVRADAEEARKTIEARIPIDHNEEQ